MRRFTYRRAALSIVILGALFLGYNNFFTDAVYEDPIITHVNSRFEENPTNSTTPVIDYKQLTGKGPVFVLLLGYQRTGSSVIGNTLGTLPGQFFLYEPLDLTYTGLYGTDPGWNIPSDIFNTPQGAIRVADRVELSAVQWTLDIVYQCSMAKHWPGQFLIHPFWFMFGDKARDGYKKCLTTGLTVDGKKMSVNDKTLIMCLNHIHGLCGGHFQADSARLLKCRQIMFTNGHFNTYVNKSQQHEGFSSKDIDMFSKYFACVGRFETLTRLCARNQLDQPCQSSNVRLVKTVRASMNAVEYFFGKYPDFRLMHLFRDPRGTVKSRLKSPWSRGEFERSNISRIAQTYCQNVLSDYRLGCAVETNYPGQSMQIISDDFMIHPVDYLEKTARLTGTDAGTLKLILARKLTANGINIGNLTLVLRGNNNVSTNFTTSTSDGGDGDELPNNATQLTTWKVRTAHALQSTNQDAPANTTRPLSGNGPKRHRPGTETKTKRHVSPNANRITRKASTRHTITSKPQGESRLNSWQAFLQFKDALDIEMACRDFFSEIPYDWQYTIM